MAIPQILQQLNGRAIGSPLMQMLPQIRNMRNLLVSSGNPQAMVQQMLQNNPNYQQISQLISNANGDPQKAFYSLCEQKGIDPNEFMNALNQC